MLENIHGSKNKENNIAEKVFVCRWAKRFKLHTKKNSQKFQENPTSLTTWIGLLDEKFQTTLQIVITKMISDIVNSVIYGPKEQKQTEKECVEYEMPLFVYPFRLK